jgi:hypothetical protein
MIMPKDQKSKLGPRATSAIFFGYDNIKKAYRCFDAKSDSIILTPTVNFQKQVSWKLADRSRFDNSPVEAISSPPPSSSEPCLPSISNLNQSISSALSCANIIFGKRKRTNKPVYSISKTLICTPAPKHYGEIKHRPDSTEWFEGKGIRRSKQE